MRSKYHHHVLLVLAISVTLVVMALYSYMYYAVTRSTNRAIQARDIAGVEKLNKDQERNLTDLYRDTSLSRSKLSTYLVHSNRIVDFIENIEDLAGQTGSKIVISSIAADELEDQPAGTIGSVGAKVEAKGSWSSVMRTLSAVELLPYQIIVDDVRLDTSSLPAQGKTAKEWRLVFTVKAALVADSSRTN